MAPSVFDRLDAEWRATGRAALPAAWPALEPRLGRYEVLDDVVRACRRRDDPRAANRVLGGLLAMASRGDRVAARAALQALLPAVAATAAGLRGYVGWGPWASRAELDAEAAAIAVELASGPAPATDWPAAVLRSRLRDRLRATVRRHLRQRWREGAAVEGAAHPVAALDHARTAEERMARTIVEAARGGELTVAAAQTVLATTVYGWDARAYARVTGRDPRAVRTHRRRTERRLAELVAG
ncbi:MAG TPA: hypothetical protein VFZ77_21675 [Acidimicrobiales bacterium]